MSTVISPSMENQELWNHYISHRNLRRKYLTFNNQKLLIELSPEAQAFVNERKKAKSKVYFNRYLEKHREEYNKIYRERYHILKAQKRTATDDDELVIELYKTEN